MLDKLKNIKGVNSSRALCVCFSSTRTLVAISYIITDISYNGIIIKYFMYRCSIPNKNNFKVLVWRNILTCIGNKICLLFWNNMIY